MGMKLGVLRALVVTTIVGGVFSCRATAPATVFDPSTSTGQERLAEGARRVQAAVADWSYDGPGNYKDRLRGMIERCFSDEGSYEQGSDCAYVVNNLYEKDPLWLDFERRACFLPILTKKAFDSSSFCHGYLNMVLTHSTPEPWLTQARQDARVLCPGPQFPIRFVDHPDVCKLAAQLIAREPNYVRGESVAVDGAVRAACAQGAYGCATWPKEDYGVDVDAKAAARATREAELERNDRQRAQDARDAHREQLVLRDRAEAAAERERQAESDRIFSANLRANTQREMDANYARQQAWNQQVNDQTSAILRSAPGPGASPPPPTPRLAPPPSQPSPRPAPPPTPTASPAPSAPAPVASSCVPKCGSRVCGSNGCGGSCGLCIEGFSCASEGRCVQTPKPSQPVTPAGERVTTPEDGSFVITATGKYFGDTGAECCSRLFASNVLRDGPLAATCGARDGIVVEGSQHWNSGAYCAPQASTGTGWKFTCTALAEGRCRPKR
jgi:hypothetical protein